MTKDPIQEFLELGQRLRKMNLQLDRTLMFSSSPLRREQWLCLEVLIQNPNLKPAPLADFLGKDRASITSLLIALENKGAIVRQKDGVDGRKVSIVVTPLGEKWHAECKNAVLASLGSI
jgi:DNA-binding MarR family transcriptional regulator